MVAVIRDSSRPTTIRVREYGRMTSRVSRVRGTFGIRNAGRLSGSWPMSPTVWMSRPRVIDTAVSRTMVTSGEGTAFVIQGRP